MYVQEYFPEVEPYIGAGEIARAFNVTYNTVRQWLRSGLPHHKSGNRTRYLLSEVLRWNDEREKSLNEPKAHVRRTIGREIRGV